MKYAVLAGRQLFSVIFIIASAGHFNPRTIDAAAAHGLPLPDLLVPLSGIIALVTAQELVSMTAGEVVSGHRPRAGR